MSSVPPAPPAPPAPTGLALLFSFVFDKLLGSVSGSKTYIAAAGLFALSVYQVSIGDYVQAIQTFMAALAAAGLRHAIAKGQ